MTFIFGTIEPKVAFQCTDRLITISTSNAKFDEFSNKNIVVLFPNMIFSIGYTGIAYIGAEPTDRYLVQFITDKKIRGDPEFPFAEQTSRHIPSAGFLIMKIQKVLSNVFKTLPHSERKHFFELIFNGWQFVGKKWKPFNWSLTWSNKQAEFSWNRHQRLFKGIRSAITSGKSDILNIKQAFLVELYEELKGGTIESYCNLMVNQVAGLSEDHPSIGKNCILIDMSPFRESQVRIKYFEKEPLHRRTVEKSTKKSGVIIKISKEPLSSKDIPDILPEQERAYCPYIITPKMVIPPSEIVGNQIGFDDNLKWEIQGPPSINKTFYTLSQIRPTKP